MGTSRISLDISLEAEGKHIGHARLPYSVNRSAYGFLPIPIASIKRGSGKTILITGGTHGDEFEGQATALRLIQQIEPDMVNGQIIIMPMANMPAAKAGTRVSPLDDGNLNRLFPGDESGTPTQMIAHFIDTVLLSRASLILDLHSGGTTLNYLPTLSLLSEKPEERESRRELARIFGAPYCMEWVGNSGIGSSGDAAARRGIIRVGTELGGAARLNKDYRTLCENGVRRVLRHVGVLNDPTIPEPGEVTFLSVHKSGFLYADRAGLFEAAVPLGSTVQQGQLAGHIYDPSQLSLPPHPLYFPDSGIVVCERPLAMCEAGDCLYHLGSPQN